MSDRTRTARRYHWLSEHVRSFVDEPHEAVCCDARGGGDTLNLVAAESDSVRRGSVELATQPPGAVLRELAKVPELRIPARHTLFPELDVPDRRLHRILLRTYERAWQFRDAPRHRRGRGAKTLRALSLPGC